MTAGFITHPDYLKHDPGPGHPERPDRIPAVLDRIETCGFADDLLRITPEPVSADLLSRVHSATYIERVRATAREGGGMLDPDTAVSTASYEVALLAAGGAVAAVTAVAERRVEAAFAAVRPPGHHALPEAGMGFCLFNNAACAAAAARDRHGLTRVCIVDWDVHHGNGTQAIFYRDPAVLFISTHQEYWYPGTGAMEETGEGDGEGLTVNVPLPAGTGNEGYRLIFEEVVVPVIRAFSPQLVVISAGYDAHAADPLGGMRLNAAGFRALADLVREATHSAGALGIAAVLEGGYDLEALGQSVVATLESFTGRSARGGEPGVPAGEVPYREIAARARQVRSVLRSYWNI